MEVRPGNLLRWTNAGGLPLVGEAFGDPSDPPVVFIHGGGQSRHAWRRGAIAAADGGFFAIAIDQRGHGESGWSADGDYSPRAIAGDLQALVRLLDKPAVLVGASRGGYSALLAASDADPPVRALVLVEIAPRIDRAGASQVRGFMQSSVAGFVDVEEAADVLARYMNRSDRKDPGRLKRSMRRAVDGRWYWHWDPKFANGAAAEPGRLEAELDLAASRLGCPTLLVRGEYSELVRAAHAAHFQSLAPHARIATIPGAGHMVSGDENDLFNAAIIGFLRGLDVAPVEGVAA